MSPIGSPNLRTRCLAKNRTLIKNLVHFYFAFFNFCWNRAHFAPFLGYLGVQKLGGTPIWSPYPSFRFWTGNLPRIEVSSRFFQSFAIFLLLVVIFLIFDHFRQLSRKCVTRGATWAPPYGHPSPWVPKYCLSPYRQPSRTNWGKFETPLLADAWSWSFDSRLKVEM